jgi:V/A-type H+/Na+-transporting ATPase subunit K
MNQVQKRFAWVTGGGFFSILIMTIALLLLSVQGASAQSSTDHEASAAPTHRGMGLVGAGIAFGLAALGAGIAVASVGAAALGVLSEKPQMLGQAFMFVALGEGIVIFGFVMAFMIMNG